jgi:DNA-binding NtrC family response regulator
MIAAAARPTFHLSFSELALDTNLQSVAEMPASCVAQSYLVLLVDEDLRTSRRMADMLREDGLSVEIAADGAAAVARLSREPMPDALVTELTTAYADGAALGRFARWLRPGMPVLVVTGYPHLFDATFFGVPPPILFTKPVDYAALRDVLLGSLREQAFATAAVGVR